MKSLLTGSTLGDSTMLRFSENLDWIVSLRDYFLLPGVRKKLGEDYCDDIRANLDDAYGFVFECMASCYNRFTGNDLPDRLVYGYQILPKEDV